MTYKYINPSHKFLIILMHSYACFQFISRFLSRDRTVLHTRVYMHRLPLANDIHDFLPGVDEEVVHILLRREATVRAFTWNMKNIQQYQLADVRLGDLDVTIHRISKQFRNIGSQDNHDMYVYYHSYLSHPKLSYFGIMSSSQPTTSTLYSFGAVASSHPLLTTHFGNNANCS